jgi:hypothetical protein
VTRPMRQRDRLRTVALGRPDGWDNAAAIHRQQAARLGFLWYWRQVT